MNNKALQLLRDGYKQDFAEYIFESEDWVDLCMKLSVDFIDAKVSIDDEEDRLNLAMMLMDSLRLGNY